MGIEEECKFTAQYEPLKEDRSRYDRAAWAWEWLRRNPDYEAAAQTTRGLNHKIENRFLTIIDQPDCLAPPDIWGLLSLEQPAEPPTLAQVFWRPDANPAVLTVGADPSGGTDTLDVRALTSRITVLRIGDQENVLISDAGRFIQLSLRRGTVLDGPVRLRFAVEGPRIPFTKLESMRRLAMLIRRNEFPHTAFTPLRHATWWDQALRAHEAAKVGLRKRDIAVQMFGKLPVDENWMQKSDWMRSRVRRALKIGEKLIHGGYRGILSPAWKRERNDRAVPLLHLQARRTEDGEIRA